MSKAVTPIVIASILAMTANYAVASNLEVLFEPQKKSSEKKSNSNFSEGKNVRNSDLKTEGLSSTVKKSAVAVTKENSFNKTNQGKEELKESSSAKSTQEKRRDLVNKLEKQVSIAFFPEFINDIDPYLFVNNTLPYLNYISEKSGTLAVGVAQHNSEGFRKEVVENSYPIFIASSIYSIDASNAGYKLMGHSREKFNATFISKSISKISNMRDAKGLKVSWFNGSSIASLLAQGFISKNELKDKTKYVPLKSNQLDYVADFLKKGDSDVVAVPNTVAIELLKKYEGEFKIVGESESVTAAGLWIRADIVNDKEIGKIVSSITDGNNVDAGVKQKIFSNFNSGFKFDPFLVKSDFSVQDKLVKSLSEINDDWELLSKIEVNQDEIDEKRSISAFETIKKTGEMGSFNDKRSLNSTLSETSSIGFMVTGTSTTDLFKFQNNYRALSNYLSSNTGILVNLVPKRTFSKIVNGLHTKKHPAFIISPIMTKAALDAGYKPVARAGESITAAFLVKKDAPFNSIKDLKNKSIASVKNSDAYFLGMWELKHNNIQNKGFANYTSGGQFYNILLNGGADAILLNSSEAEKISTSILDNEGRPVFKFILGEHKIPTLSLWVRGDVDNNDYVNRLSKSFVDFSNSGNAMKVKAFENYSKATGLSKPWINAKSDDFSDSIDMIVALKKLDPQIESEFKYNESQPYSGEKGKPLVSSFRKNENSNDMRN